MEHWKSFEEEHVNKEVQMMEDGYGDQLLVLVHYVENPL